MTIIRYHLGWQRRFPAQAWASALRPGRLSRRYGRPRRTSRSEPLTGATRANTGSQRVAWPVPVQGSGSVVDTVEMLGQGVGPFARCIPDKSVGTRALRPCPGRHRQGAGTAGQPYLEIRYLERQAGLGPAGGGRRSLIRWAVPDGGLWPDIGPRNDGERFLSWQDVAMWGVGLRTRRVGAGVLVYVTVSRDSGTG